MRIFLLSDFDHSDGVVRQEINLYYVANTIDMFKRHYAKSTKVSLI